MRTHVVYSVLPSHCVKYSESSPHGNWLLNCCDGDIYSTSKTNTNRKPSRQEDCGAVRNSPACRSWSDECKITGKKGTRHQTLCNKTWVKKRSKVSGTSIIARPRLLTHIQMTHVCYVERSVEGKGHAFLGRGLALCNCT